MGEIARRVDVGCERGVGNDAQIEALMGGLGAMGGETRWPVVKFEITTSGQNEHVGAVFVLIANDNGCAV